MFFDSFYLIFRKCFSSVAKTRALPLYRIMMIININSSIKLTQIQAEDATAIFNLINTERDYLGKWLPFVHMTKQIADTEAYVLSLVNAPAGSFEYVFTIRNEAKIIGLIGFVRTEAHNKKSEIGYWLSEKHQGNGIMTQSVKALCKFGFDELQLNRIQIKCAVGNIPSRNIPQRLGFKCEGIERQGEIQHDGSFKDLEVYSLLRSEFTKS